MPTTLTTTLRKALAELQAEQARLDGRLRGFGRFSLGMYAGRRGVPLSSGRPRDASR